MHGTTTLAAVTACLVVSMLWADNAAAYDYWVRLDGTQSGDCSIQAAPGASSNANGIIEEDFTNGQGFNVTTGCGGGGYLFQTSPTTSLPTSGQNHMTLDFQAPGDPQYFGAAVGPDAAFSNFVRKQTISEFDYGGSAAWQNVVTSSTTQAWDLNVQLDNGETQVDTNATLAQLLVCLHGGSVGQSGSCTGPGTSNSATPWNWPSSTPAAFPAQLQSGQTWPSQDAFKLDIGMGCSTYAACVRTPQAGQLTTTLLQMHIVASQPPDLSGPITHPGQSPPANPVGGFVGAAWLQGTETAAFATKDIVGIGKEQGLIDGTVVGEIDHCLPGPGGTFANGQTFHTRVPCLDPNRSFPNEWLAVDTTKVADGSHTCQIATFNSLGNERSYSWPCHVDNTPPTATLSRQGGDTSRTVQFANVADSGSGIDPNASAPQYSLDGGQTWLPLTNSSYSASAQTLTAQVPSSVSNNSTPLVRLAEADLAGNTYTTPATSITINTTDQGPASGSANYVQSILQTSGLQGFWPLDDPAGSTFARDMRGAHPAIYTATTPTGGVPGPITGSTATATGFAGTPNYSQLASTDERLDVGNAFDQTGPFSVEAWVRIDPNGDGAAHLISKDALGNGYYLYLDDDREAVFGIANSSGYYHVRSSTLSAGAWHHLVGTVDASDVVSEYVDGVRVGQANAPAPAASNPGDLTLASDQAGGNDYTGVLGDIAIYSRALSATEVAAHFQAGGSGAGNQPNGSNPPVTGAPVAFGFNTGATYTSAVYGLGAYTSGTLPSLANGVGGGIDRVAVAWNGGVLPPCPESSPSCSGDDSTFKSIYDADQAHGIKPIWVIVSNNGNCGQGKECGISPATDPTYSTDVSKYTTYASEFATAYPGSIIEVWNEENLDNNWASASPLPQIGSKDSSGYFLLLQKTYNAVKQASGTTEVVMGGLTGGGQSYLNDLYTLGLKSHTDAINVHLYPAPAGAEDFGPALTHLGQFESTRASNQDSGHPIWVTEFGATTTGTTPAGGTPVDGQRQSDDLRHYYHLLRQRLVADDGSSTPVLLLNTLTEPPFGPSNSETGYGIVQGGTQDNLPSNPTPKPAYCALTAALVGPHTC